MQQIVIVATMDVKPEYKNELIEFCQGLVSNSRQESGNVQYDLHQHMDKENTLIFVETWQSMAAINEHNETAHFKAFKSIAADRLNSLSVDLMRKIV